jgi:hypothetical protein
MALSGLATARFDDLCRRSPMDDFLNPNPDEEEAGDHENAMRAFNTLGQFLQEDNWYPQQVNDQPMFRMYYQGKHGDIRCYAQIKLETDHLIVYALAPIKVPEETRHAVAEFITRANYGLYIGNFEMDFEDGEVRFKSSLDFEGEALSALYIRNTIYPAVHLMNRYLPGLLKVVYGGKEPLEAIREVES